jgi:polyhydroxyalkanoate synthesis regulator phasin
MLELLEKMIVAGVGLANMTKEKAEALVDAMVKKGQVQAKDKKAVLNRLLETTKALDQQLESRIKAISLDILKNSHKQIDLLNQKLAKLAKEFEVTKKGAAFSKTKAKTAKRKK